MPKICKADSCNRPVFSHGYCRNHMWMWKKPTPLKRTTIKQLSKPVNKLDNMSSKRGGKLDNYAKGVTSKAKSKKRIKQSSTKRSRENALYEQAKVNVRLRLQEEGEWKCFFTLIEVDTETPYWHHKLGKEGELLYNESNIYPVQNQAHTDYHHRDVEYLIEKTDWYIDFIKRIYKTDPKVFAVEARRMMKSGNGLLYISRFFGNLVNEINKH